MWTKRAHSPAFLSFLFLSTEMITSTLPSTSTTLVKISTLASTMTTHAGRAPAPLPQARPCPTSVRFLMRETFSGMSNKLHPLSQKHARYLSHKASVIFTFVNNYTFPYSQQSIGSSVTGFAFSLMCHMKHKFSTRLLSWLTNMFNFTVLVFPPRRAPFKTHSRWAQRRTRWSRASPSISLQSRALWYFPLITEGFCWCRFTPFPPLLVRRMYIDAWAELNWDASKKLSNVGRVSTPVCPVSQTLFIY